MSKTTYSVEKRSNQQFAVIEDRGTVTRVAGMFRTRKLAEEVQDALQRAYAHGLKDGDTGGSSTQVFYRRIV